jgi:hypothetical protein
MSDLLIINDEEPTSEAMSRLWDALDASLAAPSLPGASGILLCQRCGWRWNPRRNNHSPRSCPGCHSAYWDRMPRLPGSKIANHARIAAMQERRNAENARRRAEWAMKKARVFAMKCGMKLVPRLPKDYRKRPQRMPKMTITDAAAPMPAAAPASPPPRWVREATVPPPPGLEDLEKR